MNCVKCEGKLRRVEIEEVVVDQCDRCFGIWFDSDELQRILAAKSIEPLRSPESQAKSSKADDARRASCPRCRGEGKLVQVASLTSDIHIDTCSVCGGKWLDGGELELLRGEGPLRPIRELLRRFFG